MGRSGPQLCLLGISQAEGKGTGRVGAAASCGSSGGGGVGRRGRGLPPRRGLVVRGLVVGGLVVRGLVGGCAVCSAGLSTPLPHTQRISFRAQSFRD